MNNLSTTQAPIDTLTNSTSKSAFLLHYIFDSNFESGNLDMAVQVGPKEFDLYMRVDSNTRGHH